MKIARSLIVDMGIAMLAQTSSFAWVQQICTALVCFHIIFHTCVSHECPPYCDQTALAFPETCIFLRPRSFGARSARCSPFLQSRGVRKMTRGLVSLAGDLVSRRRVLSSLAIPTNAEGLILP